LAWPDKLRHLHLGTPAPKVAALQKKRAFFRKFRSATGQTPAQLVERVQLDAVRSFLMQGLPLKAIAGVVGFASPRRLSERFEHRFGVNPSFFRETSK
jgi:transcriptional regulator GlxA family with amidase domain